MARDRLGPFQFHITSGPGDATLLARRVLLEGAEQVICVGGDGTLNEVINGFMGEDGPIRPDAVLGFIPNGTGCDFIKAVPIPSDLNMSLDTIIDSHVSSIDLGRMHYRDHQNRHRYRYFHNIASFGLGGEVNERVNKTSKVFGPFISFVWATFIAVLVYGKKRIRLRVDDYYDQEVICWNIAVANGRYHGGGMCVAPDAVVDDGLFNVTIIGDMSLAEVFRNFRHLYDGRIKLSAKVTTLTGTRVEAISDERVLLDVDGEQPGRLPVLIDIMPGALQLITNREFQL